MAIADRAATLLTHLGAAALALIALGGAGAALADTAADLDGKIEAYADLARQDLKGVVSGVDRLVDRIRADDLDGAKQAWIDARVGYERSETFVADLFPDIDREMDSWPDAETGFHAVEARLFAGDLAGARPIAEALKAAAHRLGGSVDGAAFTAQGLLNGLANLAYEVGEGKSDGAESRISGTSLDDMRHNIQGVDALYGMVFRDVLAAKDTELAQRIHAQIEDLEAMLKVASLPQLDARTLESKAETLAGSFIDAAPALGLAAATLQSE